MARLLVKTQPIFLFTILGLLSCTSEAFVMQKQFTAATTSAVSSKKTFTRFAADLNDGNDIHVDSSEALEEYPKSNHEQLSKVVLSATTVWGTTAQVALADSPDWGLFEGRIGSLLHPIAMGSMFLFSLYTAFLGFQWRRQRTLGDEISVLKKSLPNLDGAESVSVALARAKESNDLYKINSLTAALEIEAQVNSLIAERKSLAEAGPRDKHFQQGALLAFIGTVFAIEVSWKAAFAVQSSNFNIAACPYATFCLSVGSIKYIRTRWKVVSWSAPICRGGLGVPVGIGGSLRPGNAERK